MFCLEYPGGSRLVFGLWSGRIGAIQPDQVIHPQSGVGKPACAGAPSEERDDQHAGNGNALGGERVDRSECGVPAVQDIVHDHHITDRVRPLDVAAPAMGLRLLPHDARAQCRGVGERGRGGERAAQAMARDGCSAVFLQSLGEPSTDEADRLAAQQRHSEVEHPRDRFARAVDEDLRGRGPDQGVFEQGVPGLPAAPPWRGGEGQGPSRASIFLLSWLHSLNHGPMMNNVSGFLLPRAATLAMACQSAARRKTTRLICL